MKKKVCFIILWILICKLNGQVPLDTVPHSQANEDTVHQKKISFGLSIGSAFISIAHAGYGTSSFLAPSVNYRFSPRLSVNTGLLVFHNNFSVPVDYFNYERHSVVTKSCPVESQNIFYASGNYYATPRLLITGSLMQTFSTTGNIQPSGGSDNSFKIMSMSFIYKISENITIGAGTQVVHSNGSNNFPNVNNVLSDEILFPY